MPASRAALPEGLRAETKAALEEDLGDGDLSAELIPAELRSRAQVICRQQAVLCGCAWFEQVFHLLDGGVTIDWLRQDGAALQTDETVCRLRGSTRALLSGERTALNFLQLLSATATATRACVQAAGDRPVRILDTRKTLPGLRAAQKYAVRCAGGHNHRMGLYDAILLKENHLAAAGGIEPAVRTARRRHPERTVEVEIECLEQLEPALRAGADTVLLDNMSHAEIAQAVPLIAGRARIEVSGSVEADAVAELAACGVDDISIGALTKHVRAVDFSMYIQNSAD